MKTVSKNAVPYSDKQFARAKRARQLYHAIGEPSVDNFRHAIRANMIQGCPVTVKDINIAERIFGPGVPTIKGKNTRKPPKAVILKKQRLTLTLKPLMKLPANCVYAILAV